MLSIGLCNLHLHKSVEQHCQIPNIQIGDESPVISMDDDGYGDRFKPRILPTLTVVRIMYIMLN